MAPFEVAATSVGSWHGRACTVPEVSQPLAACSKQKELRTSRYCYPVGQNYIVADASVSLNPRRW